MTGVWTLAALWLGLALIASLLSIWFWIATALSEIVGRNDRAAHHRCRHWPSSARHRRIMGQVPVAYWCDRIDVSCRGGTGSRGVQAEVEGSGGRRPGELSVSISG